MSRIPTPDWELSADWAVGRDACNFILYQKAKKVWKVRGYYPSVELLLKSFFRKLTRTESADPDLLRHLSRISRRAQAAAARLYEQTGTMASTERETPHNSPGQKV